MARKKKVTLPFVVAPRREPIIEILGSEESGQIEIHRKGYLTVAEKSFMQQASSSDETVSLLHKLASKVAKARGVQAQEVVELLGSGQFQDPIFEGFEDDISEIYSAMGNYEQRRKVISATCLLYFRISQDWAIEDTMEMHPDLVDALYLLFQEEDAKSTEAFEKIETGAASEGK
jgi:hypothetical protein